MKDEELRRYYAFTTESWLFFRKYAAADGVTDQNIWEVIAEGETLKDRYHDIINVNKLVDLMVNQLQVIGSPDEHLPEPRKRVQAFFLTAMDKPRNRLLWRTVEMWMDHFTCIYPELSTDVLEGLRRLLEKHGHYIGMTELESYAEAGWSIMLTGGDSHAKP